MTDGFHWRAFDAEITRGAEGELLARLKQNFAVVKHANPKSSRTDSAWKYFVAAGFWGRG